MSRRVGIAIIREVDVKAHGSHPPSMCDVGSSLPRKEQPKNHNLIICDFQITWTSLCSENMFRKLLSAFLSSSLCLTQAWMQRAADPPLTTRGVVARMYSYSV